MRSSLFAGCWLALVLFLPFTAHAFERNSRTPNIVFLLADDLGYGDIGCFGQKLIRTPNLDRLAASGMRLTHHYSGAPVCAPSRCVLLTGLHSGHAFIRDNREMKGREGQMPIPQETVTLIKLLKQAGYATGGFGKWGLGGPNSSGEPMKQGFDRFFGFYCQAKAHNHYPPSLWDNDKERKLSNNPLSAHQKFPKDFDPYDPRNYERYVGKEYAADLFRDEALAFIDANKDRPFFLYYPTTIPHLALQVPASSLKEYQGVFPERPYLGQKNYLPHRTPHAAYAAMITRLDADIGKLFDSLRAHGLWENTIVVFTSDNGPLYGDLGGIDTPFFRSAGPFSAGKGSLREGGIRVPCIVSWENRIAAAAVSDRVTGFEDWLPTLLDLIGRKDLIPKGLDGISFVDTLHGKPQPPREFLYREFPGYSKEVSLRAGDWKLLRRFVDSRETNSFTQLYNLQTDPSESHDLAPKHPDIVKRLTHLASTQHTPSKEFPHPILDAKNND